MKSEYITSLSIALILAACAHHQTVHALQRWRHGAFMTNSEGVCA